MRLGAPPLVDGVHAQEGVSEIGTGSTRTVSWWRGVAWQPRLSTASLKCRPARPARRLAACSSLPRHRQRYRRRAPTTLARPCLSLCLCPCDSPRRERVDIDNVQCVINYDFPRSIEDYVHRIGRTGRQSKTGTALSFFTQANAAIARDLVKVLHEANQQVPTKLREYEADARRASSRRGRGGFSRFGGNSRFGSGPRFGAGAGGFKRERPRSRERSPKRARTENGRPANGNWSGAGATGGSALWNSYAQSAGTNGTAATNGQYAGNGF